MNWVLQILASVVAFVSGMLCLVKGGRNLSAQKGKMAIGNSANIILAFVSTFLAFILLAVSHVRRDELAQIVSLKESVLPWVLAFAVLFFLGNTTFFDGLVNAPNPGLARAFMTIEIAALAIFSWLLFDAPISWLKALGIVLVTIGAILVSAF